MKKRIVSLCLILIAFLLFSNSSFAHDKDKHDAIIEHVLFGSTSFKDSLKQGSKEYQALENLECAVALCIDQYQGNYSDLLAILNKQDIHGLPKDITSFDFTGNQHHRRYTHRGWNMSYNEFDPGKWEIRKTLLLQTVNYVFGFQKKAGTWSFLGKTTDYGYSQKCDAFAAFLYYIHVLGDYSASKTKSVIIGDMIPLVRSHPGDGNEDILYEMERILPIILETAASKKDIAYVGLMQDLKLLHQKGTVWEDAGGMNDENFADYIQLNTDLLNKLYNKVPGLLKNEPFFKEIFS